MAPPLPLSICLFYYSLNYSMLFQSMVMLSFILGTHEPHLSNYYLTNKSEIGLKLIDKERVVDRLPLMTYGLKLSLEA